MESVALITGVGGQDGYFLVELLLGKGYKVHGIDCDGPRLRSLQDAFLQHQHRGNLSVARGDITRDADVVGALTHSQPTEIYNLAARTRVDLSFFHPVPTGEVNAMGAARLIDSARRFASGARFYQASSAEMFGWSTGPQNECTPFRPASPYACAKLYAHQMIEVHRESYGMFACSGILFNHESSRRGHAFVTRKITRGIARILAGRQSFIELGNLEARRDWGHARDYVRAIWAMMQAENPSDYVIGTGGSRSVRELVELAFSYVGLDYTHHVRENPRLRRPADPPELQADASRAYQDFGWTPTTTLEELIHEMLIHDIVAEGLDPDEHLARSRR
jgi:GDPmannose 4,6-dehydratase